MEAEKGRGPGVRPGAPTECPMCGRATCRVWESIRPLVEKGSVRAVRRVRSVDLMERSAER